MNQLSLLLSLAPGWQPLKFRPVHFVILSFHLFFCLLSPPPLPHPPPCPLPRPTPDTMPCEMVLAIPSHLMTCMLYAAQVNFFLLPCFLSSWSPGLVTRLPPGKRQTRNRILLFPWGFFSGWIHTRLQNWHLLDSPACLQALHIRFLDWLAKCQYAVTG